MHILQGEFQPRTEGAVVQAFVRAGARTIPTALPLAALAIGDTAAVRGLQRRGLLRETIPESGQLYLDVAGYNRRRRRSQRAVIALGVLLLLAAFALPIQRR